MMGRIWNVLAVLTAVVLALVGRSEAQEAWVQIEARPTLIEAEARAAAYAGRLSNVTGFQLASGWYAIALGPFQPLLAEGELVRLRSAREIPGDSFISDGSNFGDRFWPASGQGQTPLIVVPEISADQVALPVPAEESPAEARASERAMSRGAREDLQRALQATGFYAAGIDGSFGPGTRRAMAAWQASEGFEATGIMTTAQRQGLMDVYRDAADSLALSPVADLRAGIEISLPLGAVDFEAYEAPFARYRGRDVQVFLISQAGDAATLRSLYDVLQTLEIVPLEGARRLGRGRFSIEGSDADVITRIEAVQTTDGIKGYGLVWPAEDGLRGRLAFQAMQASFVAVPGAVLPDNAGDPRLQRPDLMAGLQIRQPDGTGSGFFVDGAGAVLTASERVATCGRITVDGETEASVVAVDDALGLALLRPATGLAPLGIGRLRALPPRLQSEIAVAGYSYGAVLDAATMQYGRIEDVRGLDGEASLARLALIAQPGDAGGPVLDAAGGVVGMLLPRSNAGLPDEVRFAANAGAIARFLGDNAITLLTEPASGPVLDALDLAGLGADITVLVECWN
ncbi:MAG: serine protease [Pseudomonadota bacterium]